LIIKEFSEKQKQILSFWCDNSPYKNWDAIICDGAVRSGKTICMGISFVAWAFYRFNNSSFAICSKTINSVKRNIIFPLLSTLKELNFNVTLKSSENMLIIKYANQKNTFYIFGGNDNLSASKIQGMTLSGVIFDEVALMNRDFVQQALARCSVEGSKFWFNCNPEHPSHWFYKEWILNAKQKKALYLHFTMEDNPSLSDEIIKRYENLYTGTFFERFILGRWVAAEGLVYPFMNQDNAFCNLPDTPFEKYVVSCDYGIVNPSSFGLWGKTNNVWYRIAEYYYDSKKSGNQRTDEEHYDALKELVVGLNISMIVVDPSAASFIALIRKRSEFKVIPAKNDVIDGIRKVSSVLKQGKVKICNNCFDSIREFSLYRFSNDNKCDTPLKQNDHAMDDIRYFVSTIADPYQTDDFFVFASKR
jgi:PBSX family phage terminase large subunit